MPIGSRFRVLDRAGSELGTFTYNVTTIREGETIYLAGGSPARVVEVRDEEATQESGVVATLVVDR